MTLFSDKVVLLGVISIIVIAIASYGLFFLIQYDNEKSIRESIFDPELERQINQQTPYLNTSVLICGISPQFFRT